MKSQILKNLVILFILFIYSGIVNGQTVNISEEPKVTEMMEKFKNEGQISDEVRAWRIQIITTDDRRRMEAARAKFTRLFPSYHIEWEHVRPYYKVKVGAWEDKRSLQVFLLELKSDFPSSIPVMDDIDKSELVE